MIWQARSPITGRELPGPGATAPGLWAKLVFVSPPLCRRCGLPFDFPVDLDQTCGACLARPSAYDRARAALLYGDVSRELVLALKHQGRREGLFTYARWMQASAGELLDCVELIVPVPLHYLRHLRRGFNQSVWLAAALARAASIPIKPDALFRSRPTPFTGRVVAGWAATHCAGRVVGVRASQQKRVEGRRVLLVDDVLTTGATVESCARTLKRSEASPGRRGHSRPCCRPVQRSHIDWEGSCRELSVAAKVEIYTRDWCGYCSRAKDLLERKGIDFTEIKAGSDARLKDEMVRRSNGGQTFPQIFIDGRPVGGCDDMVALDARGELNGLLGVEA